MRKEAAVIQARLFISSADKWIQFHTAIGRNSDDHHSTQSSANAMQCNTQHQRAIYLIISILAYYTEFVVVVFSVFVHFVLLFGCHRVWARHGWPSPGTKYYAYSTVFFFRCANAGSHCAHLGCDMIAVSKQKKKKQYYPVWCCYSVM